MVNFCPETFAAKWGVYRANQENLNRRGEPKMGRLTHWLKTLNLIYFINLAEIVKNFTNFACGIGEGAIRFRRSLDECVSAFARLFDKFTVFCCKKTIDGEEFF